METLAFYLLKSVLWISGFALVYFLFLQNERYFFLNRVFLIFGILASLIFPLITWHYTVDLHPERVNLVSEVLDSGALNGTDIGASFSFKSILLILYSFGILFMIMRTIWQVAPIVRSIKNLEIASQRNVKLIRTAKYQTSFSFISYVFVNPSVNKTELYEIVNHEQEHIRQKHWIDLLLFETLRTIQWFNPVVWLYGQIIRQNHEYLADKYALKLSVSPGVYHATLLNQVFGGSVISLTNSFNYSFNKKRFNMMKHKIQSPIRKFKLLLILPIVAGIFYAFSTPKYNQTPEVKDELGKVQTTTITIGTINWVDNTVYTSEQLSKALGLKKGDVCTEEKLYEILDERISNLYLDKGYLFFNNEKLESVNSIGQTDLTFKFFEGKQFKVGKVEVKGNNNVSTSEIQKIISIRSGKLFRRAELIQSNQNLINSGKFISEEIIPELLPHPDFASVDIIFNVVEK